MGEWLSAEAATAAAAAAAAASSSTSQAERRAPARFEILESLARVRIDSTSRVIGPSDWLGDWLLWL